MSVLCESCNLQSNDNELEVLMRQLKREVEELLKDCDSRHLLQDKKIAEVCVYIKDNLSNTIRDLLDSMIESKELDRIITDTILSALNEKVYFLDVATKFIDTHYNLGDVVKTLGYNVVGVGGAIYRIRAYKGNDNIDNALLHLTANGLVAELLDPLSVENTGLTIDKLLNTYIDYDIEIGSNKVYEVSKPIIIRKSKQIDFKNSTIKYVGENVIDVLFEYGFATSKVEFKNYAGINNLKLDCNSKCRKGLHISGGKSIKVDTIEVVKPLEVGLHCNNDFNTLWELVLNNITINGVNDKGQCNYSILLENVTDSLFNNLYPVNACKSWLKTTNVNASIFSNIHGYSYPDTYKVETGFDISGSANNFNDIVVDTPVETGIKVHNVYNIFNNIHIHNMTGNNPIAIIDNDYNTYNNIYVGNKIDVVIKSSAGNYLNVSNIINPNGANNDIVLTQNKLPYIFNFDNSGMATNKLYSNFRKLNQSVYQDNPTYTMALPVEMRNTDYIVSVLVNRTEPTFYTIKKSTNNVEITFDSENIGTGIVFDVYITRPKL